MLKFKTNAKCGGCVAAIGEKLKGIMGEGDWSIDLQSPDRILTVTAAVPAERVMDAVKAAGFKVEQL